MPWDDGITRLESQIWPSDVHRRPVCRSGIRQPVTIPSWPPACMLQKQGLKWGPHGPR